MDGYAEGLQDQTVEQLTQRASDFTRRQPALVLGLAAVAGFFMFRTWKSAQPVSSPSIQPMQSRFAEHVRGWYLKNSVLPRALSDIVAVLADLLQKEIGLARAEMSAIF